MNSLTHLAWISALRISVLVSLGLAFAPAHAAFDWQEFSKREFFYLKSTGETFNYIANHSYLTVTGSTFIGLEIAHNEQRTCLFGFHQDEAKSPALVEEETKFVCFPTGKYEWIQNKEFCVPGEPACEIDPAGISIGIGNLNIVEPSLSGLPQSVAESFFDNYPKVLKVKVNPLPDFDFGSLGGVEDLGEGPISEAEKLFQEEVKRECQGLVICQNPELIWK